jgi:hypothetical protein
MEQVREAFLPGHATHEHDRRHGRVDPEAVEEPGLRVGVELLGVDPVVDDADPADDWG